MRGWFRLRDDEPLDTLALVLAVDAFPPTSFNASLPVGWTPTVELTAHVRRARSDGLARVRVRHPQRRRRLPRDRRRDLGRVRLARRPVPPAPARPRAPHVAPARTLHEEQVNEPLAGRVHRARPTYDLGAPTAEDPCPSIPPDSVPSRCSTTSPTTTSR